MFLLGFITKGVQFKEIMKREICSVCGKYKNVNKNKKSGLLVCHNCTRKLRPKESCCICGNIKRVEKRKSDKDPICGSCWNKLKPKELCSVCNRSFLTIKRNLDGSGICEKCYIAPKKICDICGNFSQIKCKKSGTNICEKCYIIPKKICDICNRLKSIAQNIEGASVCHSCYISRRYKQEIEFRTIFNLRWLVRNAFKLYSKTGKIKSSKKYGIDYNAIFKYIGPCPGNRGEYHIDHIFPLSAFDLDDQDQIKLAFSPKNHQWLKVEENLRKSDKYDKKEFSSFLKKEKICQKKQN